MHSDGFDLLTISLARGGGLHLLERLAASERERRSREPGRWPSEAAVRELEGRERRRRAARRRFGIMALHMGRLLGALGQRLSSYGLRRAAPGGRLQGCG